MQCVCRGVFPSQCFPRAARDPSHRHPATFDHPNSNDQQHPATTAASSYWWLPNPGTQPLGSPPAVPEDAAASDVELKSVEFMVFTRKVVNRVKSDLSRWNIIGYDGAEAGGKTN